MDYFSAIIYGIIQGLGEFLPISSSGHLAVLPRLLNIEDPGVFFDLAMHVGTAAAVIVYFRKRLWNLVKVFPKAINFTNTRSKEADVFFLRNFMVSTFFTFILLLVIKVVAEDYGRQSWLIAVNLIVFGIIMSIADKYNPVKQETHTMDNKDHYFKAAGIGLAQAISIFPGVSRSGITITAARMMSMSRQDAANYSFFLSLPVILGGVLSEVPHYIKHGADVGSWGVWLAGLVTCFIVGLFCIHFFLKFVSRIGLTVFAIYRILLGILILIIMV